MTEPDQMDGTEADRYSFDDATYGRVGSGTTAPTVHYVNESGVPDDLIQNDRKFQRDVASVIEQWSQSLSPNRSSMGLDVFARDKWKSAKHPFAIMSQCAWAVENDDILSTLVDVTEGLTFKKMRFELNDEDQQDVWNQWARDVDLDSRLREIHRELFKVSQAYVGMWWEKKTYKVRDSPLADTLDKISQQAPDAQPDPNNPNSDGSPNFTPPPRTGPGKGNRRRKKQFELNVPTAMTIFDPLKILPVGTLMFGRERFAYIATKNEDDAFLRAMDGQIVDPTVLQLIERKYEPTPLDVQAAQQLGVDPSKLWLMKENAVFRVTRTKAQYERFAPVRLKSLLEILDLKAHQRASDRAALIGSTNFIVVITKGSDKLPAKVPEIENLKEQARMIARLPVLVGDHRLEVKIVSPDLTSVLMETRWQVLDARIVFRSLQSFMPLVQGGNSSTGVSEMGRVVSQGLENQRHMLIRALERSVFGRMLEVNDTLTEDPDLAFAPKRVTLDFNQDIMNAILKLRDRGDVSRETALDEFDYDQDVEVVRRAREKAVYDPVFNSGTPYNSPYNNPYATTEPPNKVASDGAPPPHPGAAAPAAAPPAATAPAKKAPAKAPAKKAPAKAPAKKAAPAAKAPARKAPGRPPGVTETEPRQRAGNVKA